VKAPPVDVLRVARTLDIRVEQGEFEEDCSGILLRASRGAPVIGVNWQHHENRKRFTVAHEIGHFLLHEDRAHIDRGTYVKFRDAMSGSGTEGEEREANQFAAALLMPEDWVTSAFKAERLDPADEEALGRLASKFEVSALAMSYRLHNLGLLRDDDPFSDRTAGSDPKKRR
jgi:Zn-dependent peptidase ImmA (M78 family)